LSFQSSIKEYSNSPQCQTFIDEA